MQKKPKSKTYFFLLIIEWNMLLLADLQRQLALLLLGRTSPMRKLLWTDWVGTEGQNLAKRSATISRWESSTGVAGNVTTGVAAVSSGVDVPASPTCCCCTKGVTAGAKRNTGWTVAKLAIWGGIQPVWQLVQLFLSFQHSAAALGAVTLELNGPQAEQSPKWPLELVEFACSVLVGWEKHWSVAPHHRHSIEKNNNQRSTILNKFNNYLNSLGSAVVDFDSWACLQQLQWTAWNPVFHW